MKKLTNLLPFTLIELLVTISILAILAAILLPALTRARSRAYMVQCVNNLKQMGVAIRLYAEDSEDWFPIYTLAPPWWHHQWGYEHVGFEYALFPYIGGKAPSPSTWQPTGVGTYVCPASPVRYGFSTGWYHHGSHQNNINCYEGLWYHYYHSPVNTDAAVTPRDAAALQHRTFTRPDQTPIHFCSRRLSPVWELMQPGGNVTNNGLAAASWHHETDLRPPRPTLFLDAHVTVLKRSEYTLQGGQAILTGPYSTYELITGNAWGGKPKHNPFDFWIEEY